MPELKLNLGGHDVVVAVTTAIVAGWTGRDRGAVEEHVAELEAIGVPRPSRIPVFYRVSASRLTTDDEIESTPAATGEVEAVLLQSDGAVWVGVGSDHTDRDVEAYGVAESKQLCDKPVADRLWAYEDVADHWDSLTLRAWVDDDVLYQEGNLGGLLHPDQLLALTEPPLTDGTILFCGTFPAIGGIRSAAQFRYELEDPVLERRITATYGMRALPLVR